MPSYLRFTPPTLEVSSVRPRLTVLVALGSLACGGGAGPGKLAPQSPQETLAQFMAAVKDNNLGRMGALWGSERGPATNWMKSDEVQEGDAAASGAPSRHVVDQTVPRRPTALERAVEVRYAVTHVMNAGPALGEKLRYRARGVARLEELDLNVAQRHADDRRAVGRLGAPRLEPEDVPVESQGGVDGRNGDADVGDAGG